MESSVLFHLLILITINLLRILGHLLMSLKKLVKYPVQFTLPFCVHQNFLSISKLILRKRSIGDQLLQYNLNDMDEDMS